MLKEEEEEEEEVSNPEGDNFTQLLQLVWRRMSYSLARVVW